jgi:hypothetical protein
MIKMNSKRLAAGAAAGAVLLLTSVLPAFALEPRADGTVNLGVRADSSLNACGRIALASEKLLARLDERRAELNKRRDERKELVADRRAEHREDATERRENWSTRWDALVLEMQAKAATDAQKAAITQFKLDMQAAFNARQAALDAANTVFRTGLDKAVTDRKAMVQSAADTLKNSVKTALAKANADCEADVDSATVRATLKASLDAAHAKFRTDVQAADKIGADARALAETRRVAVEKAKEEFKAAALKARDALKAKLKANATTSATATQP